MLPRPPVGGAVADAPAAGLRADRTWVVRMVVAIVGCVLALGWLWVARAGHPSDGSVVSTVAQGWQAGGVVVAGAYGDTLHVGDLVTAVDGRPLTSAAVDRPAPRIGDVVVYDVQRDGVRM